jgi:3',5'-cyclic AMP phosphodiesterase CpdA
MSATNPSIVDLPVRTNARTTIAVLSDTHYWPAGVERRGSEGSVQVLHAGDEILATLAAQLDEVQPDAIFHLGDVTCGGGSYAMRDDEFTDALCHVHGLLTQRTAPAYALPGNHDCFPGGSDWAFFEELWGMPTDGGWTVDTPTARLVLLNAQGHDADQIAAAHPTDPVYGWVSEPELARLDQALSTAGDRPVVLFVHQLLRQWSGPQEWHDFYGVENAAAVLDVLARHGNVRAVIQGHAHRLDAHATQLGAGETTFVVVPSLIEYPLAWVRLEIDATALRLQLCPLPLPALQDETCVSGTGQAWRAGRDGWRDMTIALR